jgi:hypothetical protein
VAPDFSSVDSPFAALFRVTTERRSNASGVLAAAEPALKSVTPALKSVTMVLLAEINGRIQASMIERTPHDSAYSLAGTAPMPIESVFVR